MVSDALSIEEYLAGEQYQLGEPRGVYRRSVTFSGQVAFFAFMLLVLDLVMVVLLLAVEGLAGLSAAAPLSVVQFMIALAKILSFVRHEAVVMPFFRKVSVSVYREGLLYRRGSRTRVVRWEDIIAVSRTWRVERSKGKLKRVTYAYICSVRAQPNLALDAGIDRVAELGKLIEQEVLRRQLPQYQEKIQAGETMAFSGLSLSAQAIQYGTQSRNWSRLRKIEIGPDRLVLQDTDNAAKAFTIPLTSLSNVCFVEELLTWLSAEQEPAFLVTWEEPIPRKARRSSPSDVVKKTSHPGKITWATRLALMCIVVGGLTLQALVGTDIFQNEQLDQIPTQTYRVSSSPTLVLTADAIFVQTTSGQINFCGTFTPDSHDTFQSTSGNINLTLLTNTRFSLSSESSLTRLSNGFRTILLGAPSDAVLTTTTRTGKIAIQKGHDPGSVWYC